MNIKIINQGKDISRIIINDPKTYNSLSTRNLIDLIKVFKKLNNDKNIKVIILEGAGKGFSAGHNLKEVRGLKKKEKYQKLFNLCSKLMLQIRHLLYCRQDHNLQLIGILQHMQHHELLL